MMMVTIAHSSDAHWPERQKSWEYTLRNGYEGLVVVSPAGMGHIRSLGDIVSWVDYPDVCVTITDAARPLLMEMLVRADAMKHAIEATQSIFKEVME